MRLADPRAAGLAELYQASFAELVGYLATILGERAAAEDIAQEAGMRLLDWPNAHDEPLRQPRALLFRIATNLARDQLRRQIVRRDAAVELARADDTAASADIVSSARQELALVADALASLPPRPREVLLLSRVEGHSHREIGEQLGISPKTVENHLARALAQLATRLRGAGRPGDGS